MRKAAAACASNGIILRPEKGDYLQDGMRLLRCESMTKDGAVFEDAYTGEFFSVPLNEIGLLGLELVRPALAA